MIASVLPSPKRMKCANALRMPALLASISATVMSLRLSSLPDGSPTMVVPPPISATGFPPVSCSQCSIMMPTRLPTCSDGRGAIEADIGDERSRAGLFVEAGEIGALMDEPPLLHHAQEVGSRLEHLGQVWSLGAIEQTSRRAAPEKQLGAKSSTAVRRLLRRPSHDNRAKTAYCESISLNRVCRLMATQIEVLRAGLQMLPQVAAHSAADTPDLRSIFTPRSHEGALDPAREIVVADRGVGKSFWSSVLKDSAARSAIAPVYPRLRLSDLSVSLGVIAHVPLSVVTLGWGAGYLRG